MDAALFADTGGLVDWGGRALTMDDGLGEAWVHMSIWLQPFQLMYFAQWLGSRVVIVLDSGSEGLGSNRSHDAVA